MKKILLALVSVAFFSLTAQAQSLQVTSDTVYLTGPNNAIMTGHARVTNVGGGTISVKVKRTQVDTASGHSAYFCWTGTCYPANVDISPNFINMNPGDYDTTLLADLNPRTHNGTSTVTYCFYDMDSPNESDSACITYTFVANGVGINEVSGQRYISNVFPNPADTYTRLAYAIGSGKEARLVITNLLGSVAKEITLTDKQASVSIPTADLKTGIYVCSLLVDGKSSGSKKLIVAHK